MAKVFGKRARFYIDHRDLYLQSFELEQAIEGQSVDSTVYADDFDQFELLQYGGNMRITSYVVDTYRGTGDTSDQLLDKLVYDLMVDSAGVVQNTKVPLSVVVRETPAIGDFALFTRGLPQMSLSHPPKGLIAMRTELQEVGAIHMGQILDIQAAQVVNQGTPVLSSPGVQLGAVNNQMRLACHVFSFSQDVGTPDLDIVIQRDDNSGFASPVDYHTVFSALADVDAVWAEETTTTTDAWFRVELTANGVGGDQLTVGYILTAHAA